MAGQRVINERSSLAVGAGDSEVARQVDLSNILNSVVDVLESAVPIDVGKEVRRFDGVVPSTRLSEIIRSGNS